MFCNPSVLSDKAATDDQDAGTHHPPKVEIEDVGTGSRIKHRPDGVPIHGLCNVSRPSYQHGDKLANKLRLSDQWGMSEAMSSLSRRVVSMTVGQTAVGNGEILWRLRRIGRELIVKRGKGNVYL